MGLWVLLSEMLRLGDIVFTVCLKKKSSDGWAININNWNKKEAEHFKSAFQVDSFWVICQIFFGPDTVYIEIHNWVLISLTSTKLLALCFSA